LLNEFGATELFIVDGDSLLVELLSASSLDWSHGGQYLHLIFLLERFLQTFRQRQDPKHSFNIVFFKENRGLWGMFKIVT
jgi:hypothetical protein